MTKPGTAGRLEWGVGALTLAAILATVVGRRIAMMVEDVGFVVLLLMIVVFVVMAWWRFARSRKDEGAARWRIWASLGGCVALTLALATPLIPFFFFFVLRWGFGPRWNFKILMLGFSLAALLLGFLGARGARFPLILGGVVIGGVAALIPVGV